jgi:hypothetical protein
MYRGVVRVFENDHREDDDPSKNPTSSSPVENELTRAVANLSTLNDTLKKNVHSSQTDFSREVDPVGKAPIGYAVPSLFVRSVAEAIEQGVITYCHFLQSSDERQNATMYLLKEIRDFICSPKHLFVQVFDPHDPWYDFIRIAVFDCVTMNQIGSANLIPPDTQATVNNVNIRLYESSIIDQESVPHMPQVELSLMKYDTDETGDPRREKVIGQSVIVPLDLFVKATEIIIVLENGGERGIFYKASLAREHHDQAGSKD